MKGKVAKTAVATVMTVALATMGLVGVAFAADGDLKKGTDVLLKTTETPEPDVSVTVPLTITAALYKDSGGFYDIVYADQAYIENMTDLGKDDAEKREVNVTDITVDAGYGFDLVAKTETLTVDETLWTTVGGTGKAALKDLSTFTAGGNPGWTLGKSETADAKIMLNLDGAAKTERTDLDTAKQAYKITWTFKAAPVPEP